MVTEISPDLCNVNVIGDSVASAAFFTRFHTTLFILSGSIERTIEVEVSRSNVQKGNVIDNRGISEEKNSCKSIALRLSGCDFVYSSMDDTSVFRERVPSMIEANMR
ncbi:Uncharacterised protein [Chlamydia abortus]|nr:Uncharacterised protein [Chlamydia abortus]